MALKRNFNTLDTFSMSSMTDVIFLLLIFFMVTSTFVFPSALEINLPEGSQQTALQPAVSVYIDSDRQVYVSSADDDTEPQPMAAIEDVETYLLLKANPAQEGQADAVIAVYASEDVPYGDFVKILNLGAKHGLKMVLATKPAPSSVMPPDASDQSDMSDMSSQPQQ